jgi:PPK2 family polyphosphate:nucleotide phosphotransferase
MKIRSKDFRVREGVRVNLRKFPTTVPPVTRSKEEYQELLERHVRKLSSLQSRLYAADRYAILLIVQGMDAAGKDGVINHVMTGVNPQGCRVSSFKQPTPTELRHDFLWRAAKELPERGEIGIFNRSYYEDVLIVRVHTEDLRNEGIRVSAADDAIVWKDRYRSIVNWEKHLCENGTRIVKVYLHLSKEEQRKRFLERIDDPSKNWKITAADIEERRFWKRYMKAYGECLSATSTKEAPWYVVPADDKVNARLITSQIVVDALDALKVTYPEATKQRRQELRTIRNRLAK